MTCECFYRSKHISLVANFVLLIESFGDEEVSGHLRVFSTTRTSGEFLSNSEGLVTS